MKLSIIIPTYNVQDYLERCISSCLNQNIDINSYEIIVVNDGSQDKSLSIAQKLAAVYNNISIISQSNAGLSAARNKGLSLAQGEYVWFIDADDAIKTNSLKKITSFFNKQYDVIAIGWGFYYESNKIKPQLHDISISTGLEILEKAPYPMGAQFYIYKKKFLEKHSLQFKKGIFHEDNEFTPRMLFFAQKAIYIKEMIYYYTVRESGSILSTPNPKKAYDLLSIAQSTIDFAEQHVPKDKRFIYYNLAGIAFNNSIRNIKQHSNLEQQNFYQELKKVPVIFKSMQKSTHLKYKIEGFFCKISLPLFYKLIIAL